MTTQRTHFGSRLGAILAAAGSAVGLGNIWRFPCETGANGGAAFILVYIFCIAIVALPVLITELTLGRHARANVYDAYRKMGGTAFWRFAGLLGVCGGFLVLSYYGVVAGWTLEYTYESISGNLLGQSADGYAQGFVEFSSDPLRPMLWMVTFIVITAGIVLLGVQRGIERGAKLMMPLLAVLLVVLMVCSLSLPGSAKGVEFLLKPDFSKLTPQVFMSALGQAFFTLSIGIGTLMTYASYFSDRVNIIKDSCHVALIDTLVAILAGLIIFPAALAVGVSPDAGPSLVFITLPNVFQQAFGGVPLLSYVVTVMFYLLLVMAAMTSSISMLEESTAFVTEKFNISRLKAVSILTVLTLSAGALCSLSFGPWADVTVMGMGFFDLFDFLVAKFCMPLGGIFSCVMLSRMGKERVVALFTNNGTLRLGQLPVVLYYLIKYVVPLLIAVIFINELLG